ncbi:MAG: hypothetical protein O7C63_04835 [Alphaproteobacteria bacterium]|nr:hypothetical protein [Alphaproteobacteria bacterium]MCZ6764244.1 hypothetical protein [Alphaproteobacteria bacterium]
MIAAAAQAHPRVAITPILDCADKPGLALAALRLGHKHLSIRGRARGTIAAIAKKSGATLHDRPRAPLDLLDVTDPGLACERYMGSGQGSGGGR